ncbi:MAG: Gfo/Idh/MocA family oxidoreductase [Solirubrobacterales bacterium]
MVRSNSAQLRAVVAGLGVMGSNHCRVLSSLVGVELAAAVDPDTNRRAAVAETHPAVRTHASLEQALATEDLDIACIATPVDSLAESTLQALRGGLHVLVEKPTARTEQDALAMAQEADERQLVLGVGHVERFNPAVMLLKTKLEDDMIGRVLQMHARRLSPFPNRASMMGVGLDLATHDIDVMRYLSGSEVSRVYAETAQRVHDTAEDLLCATLRFDNDSTGLLEVNWITPAKVRELSVTGERGMFVLNYLTQELLFYEHPTKGTEWDALSGIRGGGEGDMIRFALERREPLRVEWEKFLQAVRDGSPPPVSVYDGLAALSTATAIQRAGAQHEVLAPGYRETPVA